MDSHYFGYSVSSTTDLSYSSSSYPAVAVPTSLFESLKFDYSPFSTHSETETTTLRAADSLEQNSSTDSLTEQGATPTPSSSSNSSLQLDHSEQSRRGGLPYSLPNADYSDHDHHHHNIIIRNRLLELETALMAPDTDDIDEEVTTTTSEPFLNSPSRTPAGGTSHSHHQSDSPIGTTSFDRARHKAIPPSNLKQLLIACATALSENELNEFEKLIEHARSAVSISGEPIQRLGAYLVEGLIARKESSGTNIYRALKCNQPDSKDLLSYMHILYEICPYLKFGYLAANGAIAEACKNEDRIHIVDFQIAQGTQWIPLLQALAARPRGPPHIRITGIDDPVSKYARGDSLTAVGRRLAAISEKFNIPVEFHPVPVFAPDITRAMLDIRPGEALAANFPLQLHHTPDESVDVSNPRDGLLRMVKSLSPKVVTLVEQESNTNTTSFVTRFVETLDYYSAMFESIDVTMGRERKERINVEQHCLARDIVNIVACEGKERVERHELFGKWRLRFMMAGFEQFPLSCYVNSVIRGLLRCYSEHYTLLEKDGAMLLGWKDRNLVSASAWH